MTETPEQHLPIPHLGAQTTPSKISIKRIERDDQNCRAIFVFPNHEAAILAFDQLILAGFSNAKVLIVGGEMMACDWMGHRDSTVEHTACVPARVVIGTGGAFRMGWRVGSMLGGIIGFLLGLSVTTVPGVTGIALASKFIYIFSSGLFCTISGGVLGAGIGLKFAQNEIEQYVERVSRGEYLLVVSDTATTIRRIKQFMKDSLQKQ